MIRLFILDVPEFRQVIEKAAAKLPSEKKVTPDDFDFSKVLGKGNYGKVAKNPFPLTKKELD